jgi:hypothetical protein
MARIIPADYGEVQWIAQLPGDTHTTEVTVGVALDGSPTASDVFDLYTDGGWQDLWHAIAVEQWTMVRGRCVIGDGTGSPPVVETIFADDGATGSDGITPNTAVLIKKSTGLGGRANRGRMYWPGVDEDSVAPTGALDSGFVSGVQVLADALIPALNVGPFIGYVILHTDNSTPTPITGFLVESTVATQRRRLPR